MNTIQTIKNLATQWHKANIPHAQKTVCKILSLKHQKPFEEYYFYQDTVLDPLDLKYLECVFSRLKNGEPFSKIMNISSFFGYDFIINEHVLDPRPDTETLIEEALRLFDPSRKLNILDLGTGSGCLIISLLLLFKNAKGLAVDFSNQALCVAKKNAKKHTVDTRLTILESNWFSHLEEDYDMEKFDLIVSNPPYISTNFKLDQSVINFDPHLALFSGEDGLDDYRKIFKKLHLFLHESGFFLGEIGFDQTESIFELLKEYKHLKFITFVKDLNGINRIIVIQKSKDFATLSKN
ncbi:MAG: Release factor glutamine methyltransferase [Holosporales bacterium]